MKFILSAFDFKFERTALSSPSVLSLIVANLFPVCGVVFLGWDVFLLLLLFWVENLIVGFYTVLKMLTVSPPPKSGRASKASAIPFFCIHYGMFTLVHGIFVVIVFGGGAMGDSSVTEEVNLWQKVMNYQVGLGGLTLLISHGISFFQNYIGGGEYKRSTLTELMGQPYGRVVILHLTIIFGGMLMALLGSPAVGLLFLIGLKTAIDIRAHLREHAKHLVQKPAAV